MKVIERKVVAKRGRPEFCEDLIVENEDYLAIIDGITDKHGHVYSGSRTGGRFVADELARAIGELPADLNAPEALQVLSGEIARAISEEHGGVEGLPLPGATAAIYSRPMAEIWRIGTIHVMIDGMPYPAAQKIDEITSQARAAYTKALLLSGRRPEEIEAEDPGREMILPLLEIQHQFENHPSSEYATAVFNGLPIPLDLCDILPVSPGSEVVIASDGYPRAAPTLEASELLLHERLRSDPMMIDPPAQTKGRRPHEKSFDDRSYIRFKA